MSAILVLAPVLAGCAAGQPLTASEIVEKMRDTMRTTKTVESTASLALTINKEGLETLAESVMPGALQKSGKIGQNWKARVPDTASAKVNFWKESPNKARIEVTESSLPDMSGATLVSDGQKVYALDAGHNKVYTGTPSKMEDLPDELKGMLESADIEETLDKLLAATTQKVLGEETVANLGAYKVEFTPQPDAAAKLGVPEAMQTQAGFLIKDATATMWVDKARWMPLKLVVEHPNMGEFSYTVESLKLNEAIDPLRFVLQVPAGAETVDLDAVKAQMKPKTMTLQGAAAEAKAQGWDLLDPGYLPQGATLVEALKMPGNVEGGGLLLNYSSPAADFSIFQAKIKGNMSLDEFKGLGDGFSGRNTGEKEATQEVTVRGNKAVAFSPAGANWTSLMWTEKDSGTVVAIRGKMSVEEAVKIGEGLK